MQGGKQSVRHARSSLGCCEGIGQEKDNWFSAEFNIEAFPDVRLGKRFLKVLEQLWQGIGKTIRLACQDWANTKAAYRFFSNERIDEKAILSGHFASTKLRAYSAKEMILVLHA